MRHETAEEHWHYNCQDCVITYEIAEVLEQTVSTLGLTEVEAFQTKLFYVVLEAMQRGVRIDLDARVKMKQELSDEIEKRSSYFTSILGHSLNPGSNGANGQMQKLFYGDLHLPIIKSRKTGQPTLDDEALARCAAREPLVRPLIKAIQEYRSLGVFLSTFIEAPLDWDNRMRCSYNICGTETYRFASGKNAFAGGTNLQNVPKGIEAKEPDELSLPNIRKIFIPDDGFTFFDMDLDRADLQVVVWEADDADLKQMLHEGVDIHAENAKALGISRQLAKSWVHGTNYGGGPRTMATNCGISIHQADTMRKRWFAVHPGIEKWHSRVEDQLRRTRSVDNRFGYRRFYFDRIDGLLPEALAWIPQSTVACYINRVWVSIFETLKEVQVLLQVHDSLCGQMPSNQVKSLLPRIRQAAQITVPYDDPLIIPINIKTSEKSWGHC